MGYKKYDVGTVNLIIRDSPFLMLIFPYLFFHSNNFPFRNCFLKHFINLFFQISL